MLTTDAVAPPPQHLHLQRIDVNRSLWVGDLQIWMDEQYLLDCFAPTAFGKMVSVQVIRNKYGESEGYGYIEFDTRETAEAILNIYNSSKMPNSNHKFTLNWALMGGGGNCTDGTCYTVFVENFPDGVTDIDLEEFFRYEYRTVRMAKVVVDRITWKSQRCGYVGFGDEDEQRRAINEMNGRLWYSSTDRILVRAADKNEAMNVAATYQGTQGQRISIANDPTNATLYLWNLDPSVTEEDLAHCFEQHGPLVHVKILLGMQCAVVQFAARSDAQVALRKLNENDVLGQRIRVRWDCNP